MSAFFQAKPEISSVTGFFKIKNYELDISQNFWYAKHYFKNLLIKVAFQ